jgi:hypothetical protein
MIDTSSIDKGENFIHYGAIRIRVVGSGNLIPTFQSRDQVITSTQQPFVMQATNPIEPLKLTNFTSQGAFLRVETLNLNETFRINRIVVFVKPIWGQTYGQ